MILKKIKKQENLLERFNKSSKTIAGRDEAYSKLGANDHELLEESESKNMEPIINQLIQINSALLKNSGSKVMKSQAVEMLENIRIHLLQFY